MIKVNFYDKAYDSLLKFAVIVSKQNNKWVFVKHRERSTYECPGGHRENGEKIEDAARRELWEETGAVSYDLTPVCIYSVESNGEETYGKLYFANIREFGKLPALEIEKVELFDEPPESWTYPQIQPLLLKKVEIFLNLQNNLYKHTK